MNKHLLAGLLILISSPLFAETYKWVNEDGVVTFSQSPPPDQKAERIKLRWGCCLAGMLGEDEGISVPTVAGGLFPAVARRFAAKEACSKALGTGIRRGVFWRDMGVVNLRTGQPTMALTGGALAQLEAITPAGMDAIIHLTITDDDTADNGGDPPRKKSGGGSTGPMFVLFLMILATIRSHTVARRRRARAERLC